MKKDGVKEVEDTKKPSAILEEEEEESPWDQELTDWEENESFQDSELRISVYRQDKRGAPKEKVWEYIDEVVSSHDIGLTFGGGRYHLFGRIVRDGQTLKTIRRVVTLGSNYTEYAKARKAEAMGAAQPVAAPKTTIKEWVGIIMEAAPAIAMLREIFVGKSTLAEAKEMQAAMQGIIMQSAANQMQLLEHVKKDATVNHAQSAEEEDPDLVNDMKEYLRDSIREYGPTILQAVGFKLKQAMKIVKGDEVFQSLSENPRLLAQVYKKLSDGQSAEEKALTAKVLKKLTENGLGFNIPTMGQEQTQEQTQT